MNINLTGAEPAEIRQNALNCVDFVDRELERMTTGIMGFTDYVVQLLNREAKFMGAANRRLKSQLSQVAQWAQRSLGIS